MPVFRDESGKRWVQAEAEVPGTPEQVWAAIATGPGISSWFVPTQVEEREGGEIIASFGPGMDSKAVITEWNPPLRFVADSRDDMGPSDPTVATEWIVESTGQGTCIVRVVHSWFTSSDNWDQQFEGHTHGWIEFFRILKMYLAHFAGQPSAAIQQGAFSTLAKEAAWAKLAGGLGIQGVAQGGTVQSAVGAPPLGGVVEEIVHPEALLLRLDSPAPGIAHLFAMPMGGSTYLSIRLFLFGPSADSAAREVEPQWQAWLAQEFPPPAAAGPVECKT